MAAYLMRVQWRRRGWVAQFLNIDTNDMRDDILISAIDFKSITWMKKYVRQAVKSGISERKSSHMGYRLNDEEIARKLSNF